MSGKHSKENDELYANKYLSRFRVIPFSSLGKQNGMLLGIKADEVIIQHDEEENKLNNVIYCEPFSGGAGVAMELLLTNKVNSIILNDLDIAIYSFWYALLNETKKFIKTIQELPINLNTWYAQKNIYNNLNYYF